MKNFIKDIWERICHWQTTAGGIILAVLLYVSMGYAIQKEWTKFSEAATFVGPILMVVFGALFKYPSNQPPNSQT